MEKLYKVAKMISSLLIGQPSKKQKDKLDDWIRESVENTRLAERILDKVHIREDRRQMEQFDKEEGWKRICERRGVEMEKVKKKTFSLESRWKYVAAVVVMSVGVGTWMLFSEKPKPEIQVAEVTIGQGEEMNGAKGVQLKLQNGQWVDLGRKGEAVMVDSGVIANDNGALLSYEADGRKKTKELIYNEIYVPKGIGYQLKLSDGTIVYLNSMSKVRYPVTFGDNERKIELEGEAFFEVAKDSARPFIVETRALKVRVLGTKFNLSSYEEDETVQTTLVEGAVQISSDGNEKLAELKPSEQLTFRKADQMADVTKVEVGYYTAWKDGWFRFRDIRLEDLMKILKRWYDMDVVYQDREVKDYLFGCNFSRDSSIESLVRIFEQNGKVKISQDGKALILSKGR